MKEILTIIFALSLAAAQVAASSNEATTTLYIEGMQCRFCATVVRLVAKSIDGVKDAKVSRQDRTAIITYDPSKITQRDLARSLTKKLASWTPPGGKAYSATGTCSLR